MGLFHKLFHRGEVDCNEVQKLSSDSLEEDFAPPKRSAFQAHLDNCGPCRAFVDTLASTIGILSRLPQGSGSSNVSRLGHGPDQARKEIVRVSA